MYQGEMIDNKPDGLGISIDNGLGSSIIKIGIHRAGGGFDSE